MPQLCQPSRATPKVVAAIPCFNTERFIKNVVAIAKKHVDQVIVINDGSCDGTAEVARAAGALVVTHDINRGYGESVKHCFTAAKENSADVLVIFDGDGQHNPDELPQVLAPLLTGEADLVIGSRFLSGKSNMPLYRKLGNNVIAFLYNFAGKEKVSDAQSGFRAYNKRVLDAFPITGRGMGLSVEIIIKARDRGFNIKEVPISCWYHSDSSSLNPVTHGLSVVLSLVKFRLFSLANKIRGKLL